jgi:hypothetical protein
MARIDSATLALATRDIRDFAVAISEAIAGSSLGPTTVPRF